MKVAAILFLAAALGSASPVRTPKSIQSRDGQNECDCSKPLYADISCWDSFCPDGYEDISTSALSMSCRQVSCSEQDYKEAQCGAKPKEEPPKEEAPKEEPPTIMVEEPPKNNTCVEQPTKKPAAPSVNNACDCSKSLYYENKDSIWGSGCPGGYEKSTSFPAVLLPCRQVGCSEQDYSEAQCGAKPKEELPKEEPLKEEPLKEEKEEKEETPKEETPKEHRPKEETPKEQTPTIMAEEPPKNNTCVEQPTKKPAAPSVKNACDCSKPLRADVRFWVTVCPDGYENISATALSSYCQQVGCSKQDYNKAQCGAKSPQDANSAIDPRNIEGSW
ncbi:hypothetical protein HC256_006372 [Beauveria bassiana]|nr:hypothetical protein HC256_006372 [Beauveria bassiana]